VLGTTDFEMSEVSVYPNPTSDVWNVSTMSQEILSIDVYDVLGKIMFSIAPTSSEASIDGSAFNSGLYFAQIKTNSGIRSFKLLKQ
jgi:hypothetical protein